MIKKKRVGRAKEEKADKRITKTKTALKETMRRLLRMKPFSSITVTELCKDADTSRITFYSHYDDKYALMDEMVRDMVSEATDRYLRLQKEHMPAEDPGKAAENLVDAMMDSLNGNSELFQSLDPRDSDYVFDAFYSQLVPAVAHFLDRYSGGKKSRSRLRLYSVFLCSGMRDFLRECKAQQLDSDALRANGKQMASASLRAVLECL